ncbi:MAG: vWA domain-containing protein, partial [Acidimicrobiales bacterium]
MHNKARSRTWRPELSSRTGKNRFRFLTLLACLSLLAAACGSSDDTTASAEASADAVVEPASDIQSDVPARPDSDDSDSDATSEAMEEEAAVGSVVAGESRDEAMSDAPDAVQQSEDGSAGLRSQAPTTTTAAQQAGAADQAEGGFFGTTIPEPEDEEENNTFKDYGVRPFVSTDVDPLSTFALDVDTASYSVARQWLESGAVPPAESVRVEEYLNSFDYDYIAPRDGLNVQADGGPSPYDPSNVIVRVGVQAEQVANADRPDAALTFVVDTSGSMDRSDRLALVKTSLTRLTQELESRDTVSIVTYSGDAQILLPPTSVRDDYLIFEAIDRLAPTGSTNLEAGLIAGYEMANESFRSGGINRVVLASDGVANVGLTDPDALARLIRDDADRGIQLVTVGVGMGNFNDVVMEQLADQGDGFYAYVNDEREAEKLFSDDLVSTLLTVAIDGKI